MAKKKRKADKEITTESGSTRQDSSAQEQLVSDEDSVNIKKPAKKKARTISTARRENEMSSTKIFLVLSFIVPFLILGYMFVRADIYPFGDRQVLYSDCKQQYLPFLKEFQRKLQSGDSMFYSWHSGMGTNFLAMIGYYISSPLNLLTLFVPIKYIREAMAVIIMTKVGLASLFTAVFLKNVYKRNDLSLTAFGCCYAFCDFFLGYYWNVIWLDSVALLPLCALGVYCVVYQNKYKTYIISLAIAFLSSYYIGYMLCVFIVLWFVVQSVIKGFELTEFCVNAVKMAGYSVIALCMTLPVTLVSYIQLQNTVGTEDSFPDKIEIYNNFMEMLANLFSFHKPTTMEGLPNVGAGVVCILMTVIFVRSKVIARREKIALISLLGFLFVSLNVNVLDYIWHGFHFPNLIPYRFAFLFSFVFVVTAYRAFTAFVQLDKFDLIGMCIITIVMICVTVFYLDKTAVIGSLIVAGVHIMFMTLYELDLLNRRMLVVFASLAIIAEMCFRADIGVDTVGTTSWTNYPADEEEVTELADYAAEQSGGDLFRIDQEYYSTKNDGMIYGYNSAGQFSSTSYRTLIDFTSDFGIVSKRSSFQYLLTSPVVSMLLNEKYLISRDGYNGNDPSLKEIKTAEGSSVTLYENKYYLPIGYMAKKGGEYADLISENMFINQNEAFSALTGVADDVYTILDPYDDDSLNFECEEESKGLYKFEMTDGMNAGEIKVMYKAPEDGMLYAWANIKSADTIEVKSSELNHTYEVEAQRYIFPLGYYKKGEIAILDVAAEKRAKNRIAVGYLNEDVLDRGYKALKDQSLRDVSYTSTRVSGIIAADEDGLFMTSIPWEKGWTLYVDGVKTETKAAMGAFLCADIGKGEHEIELSYVPEGFAAGCVIGGLALLVFVGMCLYDRRKSYA